MLKRLLFFMGLLFLSLTGCELIPGGPEIVLDPNVTFTVSKDTLRSGEKFTIIVSMENVSSTENNFGVLITTSGQYEVVATSNMTELKITAKNVIGKSVTFSKNITVLTLYDMLIDSICSKPLFSKPIFYDSFDDGINWIENKFPDAFKDEVLFFHKNLKVDVYKSTVDPKNYVGTEEWSIDLVNRIINFGGNGPKKFFMTDKTFTIIFTNSYFDDKGKEHPKLVKYVYTR